MCVLVIEDKQREEYEKRLTDLENEKKLIEEELGNNEELTKILRLECDQSKSEVSIFIGVLMFLLVIF